MFQKKQTEAASKDARKEGLLLATREDAALGI